MNEKEMEFLNKETNKIQPKTIQDERVGKLNPEDRDTYEKIMGIYEFLCTKDSSFILEFSLKNQETEPFIFYRLCPLEEQERFQNIFKKLFWNLYVFLCHSGYISFLEKIKYLRVYKKGKIKSFEEKNAEKIKELRKE